ncbi:hypothetical protein AB0393_28225 [Streptomyces cyaneofuscatus]|uniref:hypothetical protein n=1 Tax=Streptomyces cyaneofuscatus TaxID=66883 RepID=UPI00344DE977
MTPTRSGLADAACEPLEAAAVTSHQRSLTATVAAGALAGAPSATVAPVADVWEPMA